MAPLKRRRKPHNLSKKINKRKNILIKKCGGKKNNDEIKRKQYVDSLVKRLYSPYNKFKAMYSQLEKYPDKKKKESPQHVELSSKERVFILNYCQKHKSKYLELKCRALKAIEDRKIFSIYDSCPALRKALVERGWIEGMPNMSLKKVRQNYNENINKTDTSLERLLLSDIVKKNEPNFIWFDQENYNNSNTNKYDTDNEIIINRLKNNELWTTKLGLCERLKNIHWHHIDDVAEINSSRTYSTSIEGDLDDFISDYHITACTSLLKWVLSMTYNDRIIFYGKGKVPFHVVIFAINRCKEYLNVNQQHKDIDHPISEVSSESWSVYLKYYYRVIAGTDIFEHVESNLLKLYLKYILFLLKEMHKLRPQLSCEGCHNIWILKPAHCSRGRGIRLSSKLSVMLNLLQKTSNKYIIQKYIEEPFLLHNTKFDIRIFYLVTNTHPLHIYVYKDCYLKFSSQSYNLENLHESIHLTNNAVQKKYNTSEPRITGIPSYSMWNLDTFKEYLISLDKDKVWSNIIYPGMKKSIVGVMLASQDLLPYSRHRFELYGCDFILDNDFKPWLIEINSCPDLKPTTPVTANICANVIKDLVKVVIDKKENPNISTGNFELAYKQFYSLPRYGIEMSVEGVSLPNDYFYKGKVQINDSFEDVDIEKESGIKALVDKIKDHDDVDVMKAANFHIITDKISNKYLNNNVNVMNKTVTSLKSLPRNVKRIYHP